MHDSKNFTLYECEDYEFRLEYNRLFMALHLPRVSKWNKSVFLSMLVKVSEVKDFSVGLGYPALHCAVHETNEKILKLATRLGFTPVGNSDGLVVFEYRG
jgi:hypothetical protein